MKDEIKGLQRVAHRFFGGQGPQGSSSPRSSTDLSEIGKKKVRLG